MHIKNLLIKDFDYELREEKIAKYPLQNRDESKLLIYKNETIEEDIYFNLDKHLPADSFLIFNNTKVIEARLLFEKNEKTTIEIFCLEPADEYGNISSAMLQCEKIIYKCLVGGAKKWKDEILKKNISANGKSFQLNAKKIQKDKNYFRVEFSWNAYGLSFSEVLHFAGIIPLPPYLKRGAEEKDNKTYQTAYAEIKGSVAAPTAGLHFTEKIFEKLSAKKIDISFITLHVSAGTFLPVKTASIADHEMHAEFFDVSKSFIKKLMLQLDKNIVAVGTTSLRTIETLYWMGVKCSQLSAMGNRQISVEDISVTQWLCYDLPQNISAKNALKSLLKWMDENNKEKIIAKTQIIIAPPYQLKIAQAIITNFHQPRSTLLLLVAAIAGDDWKKIYSYALKNDFRFLSYGDGSLIWKHQ